MRAQITQLLTELVGTNSISGQEGELTELLAKYFKAHTIKSTLTPDGRKSLIIEKGIGEKVIALYAHLDTVNVVDGWTKDPYTLTIEGDQAYGLGSFDMKGGLCANILTFDQVQPTNYKLQLILCVDEEDISQGGYSVVQNATFEKPAAIISPEPAFKHGINGVTTGRPGRAVFSVEFSSESAHSMFYTPETDVNLVAAEFIKQLPQLFQDNGEGRQFVQVRKYESAAVGMSTPASCKLELEAFVLPPNTNDQTLAQLNSFATQAVTNSTVTTTVNFKPRLTPFLPAYRVSDDSKYLKLLDDAVLKITGNPAVNYFRSSVGDDNIFGSLGIDVLGIGPEGGNAHAPDEWVSLASIEKLYLIQMEFLTQMSLN